MTGRGLGTVLLLTAALAACSDTAGPDTGAESVAVRFSTTASSAGGAARVQNGSLVLTGTNGTLQLDEIQVLVDRFELKRVDDDHCVEEDHSCERFRAGPMLLDLPLGGSSVIAVEQVVDTGTYRKLKFEIEDLDDEDDDSDSDAARAPQIRALRTLIRARFPDWPKDASMRVVGTFTPTGGQPVPFQAYFEAEIEIERRLTPPVLIDGNGGNTTFTVELDAAILFRSPTGTVLNLGALDFTRSGRVPELEVELEHGFSKVEFDD